MDKDKVLLRPHGIAIMGGLMGGIGSQIPALERQLAGVTGMIAGNVRGAHGRYGHGAYGPDEWVIHTTLSEQQLIELLVTRMLRLKRIRGFPVSTSAGLGLA
jgi:hypothetical protein